MLQRVTKGTLCYLFALSTIIVACLLTRTCALLPITRRGLLTRATLLSTMATDEFDDSFLVDFDVDSAIQSRQATMPSPRAASNKRFKVTPSQDVPSSSTVSHTAVYAARSPFAKHSKFSTGTTTNPKEELANDYYSRPPPVVPLSSETTTSTTTRDNNQQALEVTLQTYFGYSKFRPGQLEVLQAVLDKRDVAIFWATGSGKSICYQIPPLHTNSVALVVSPLISLMQDQCNKLNGLSEQPLATFLGSAQLDSSEEAAAFEGKYHLIYVTPEKVLQRGFLERIGTMHTCIKPLCLIAIDESHCVSEWGHDFRPEYRRLDELRKKHPNLSQVPLVALTATAVPRVQSDIVKSLGMRNPLLSRQTFDRTNLVIEVHKKKGMHAAMEPLLEKLSRESTIVYAPTRDQVDELAKFLSTKLGKSVEAYHAGLPQEERSRVHTNFLVGQTKVIVATVAFGMGIDKPDTRRVIHYGPPKTVEEYYQQIGRAGRDGLPAECLMFVSDGDFDRYKGDFYVCWRTLLEKWRPCKQGRSHASLRSVCTGEKWVVGLWTQLPGTGKGATLRTNADVLAQIRHSC